MAWQSLDKDISDLFLACRQTDAKALVKELSGASMGITGSRRILLERLAMLAERECLALVIRTTRDADASLVDVMMGSRDSVSVAARHRSWAIIRWTLGLSYPVIARMFGTDHSTVLKGVRSYEEYLSQVT